jgi:hypothetical protein
LARFPILGAIVGLVLLVGCQAEVTPVPATATQPAATSTALPATASSTPPAPTATQTVVPTPTASPTVLPSDTPVSTATEQASATHTPLATQTASATTGAASPTAAATPGTDQTIFNTPSVWNTSLVGGDNMSGNCTAAVNPPYGLVLITPQQEMLLWHNTVPEDYGFQKIGDNNYLYAGPTGIGDGTVTMELTFTSPEALQMTRVFIANTEPDCTHTHTYAGVFQYFRP